MKAIALYTLMPNMDGPAPTLEASESSSYMTAPNSPTWVSVQGTAVTTATITAATTVDSDSDEFAFEISFEAGQMTYYGPPWPHKEEGLELRPSMSSVDRHFSNGVAWPLRPPPQLEVTGPSGASATLGVLNRVKCGSFSGLSVVPRESDNGYMDHNSHLLHRRTQSLSPCWGPAKATRSKSHPIKPIPPTLTGDSSSDTGKSDLQKKDTRGGRSGSGRLTGPVRSRSESEKSTGKSTKQKIKDFLLFRIASAGRADPKDKDRALIKPIQKAADPRWRTRLAYKQSGFFGCLRFGGR